MQHTFVFAVSDLVKARFGAVKSIGLPRKNCNDRDKNQDRTLRGKPKPNRPVGYNKLEVLYKKNDAK